MVLKNVACPECGNMVSFTISEDKEITDIKTGTYYTTREDCGNCGETVGIKDF